MLIGLAAVFLIFIAIAWSVLGGGPTHVAPVSSAPVSVVASSPAAQVQADAQDTASAQPPSASAALSADPARKPQPGRSDGGVTRPTPFEAVPVPVGPAEF